MDNNFTILCCTDFSQDAMTAFKGALTIASHHPGTVIHLLNVLRDVDAQFWNSYLAQSEQDTTEIAHNDIVRRINDEYLPLISKDTTLVPDIRAGRPVEQILALADEINADLIVMGRQNTSHSGFKSFFFGDVSLKVAAMSKCPTLLIPLK